MYPGLPAPAGKKLVSSKPRELSRGDGSSAAATVEVSISIGGGTQIRMATTNLPHLVDLDGNGRSEILMVSTGGGVRPGKLLILTPPGGISD